MRGVVRWIGEHPLSDWRWPAAVAVAMFAAVVLISLVTIRGTIVDVTGKIRDRGDQSLCQQQVEAKFERAVGHAVGLTPSDRADPSTSAAIRADINSAVHDLERVDEICPTK